MSDDLKKNIELVVAISKGIIRDQRVRRKVLGAVLGAAVAMLITGAFLIDGWLGRHLIFFLIFWLACAWLTFLAILMALFEMLMVKAASRAALRKAQAECQSRRRRTS